MPAVPEDDRQALLASFEQTVELLRRYSKDSWVKWLEEDRVKIAAGDSYGIDHLLSAVGGMGSLNDLVICPVNGDNIEQQDVARMNAELSAHRDEIWTIAGAIQRQLDS